MIRSLHRWLGLVAGLWLAWLGLTGSLLAVAHKCQELSHPNWHHVAARPPAAWEFRRQQLQRQFPDLPLKRWEPARAAGLSERVLLGPDLAVYLDPADGRVLGAEHPGTSLAGLALRLHTLAEPLLPGVALLSAITLVGGYLLQPFRRQQWRQPWSWRPLDLHRRVGWLSLVWLLLSLVTGTLLVKYKACETWLRGAPAASPPLASGVELYNLDLLVQAAQAAVPKAELIRLEFPQKPGQPFTVRLRQAGELNPKGRTFVHLDPASGAVLLVEDPLREPPGVRLLQAVYPLHAGYYPGGGVVLALLGLCPAALWWSGWRMRSRRLRALQMAEQAHSGVLPISSRR